MTVCPAASAWPRGCCCACGVWCAPAMLLAAAAAALISAATGAPAAASGDGVVLIPTPFGPRPVECVVEVPNGAHVDEDEDGLLISHPLLGTWRHTPDPVCSQYAPVARRPPAHTNRQQLAANASADPSCNDMPCTCDSLPCNNWIDTAGWMLSPYDQGPYIGGFSTVMSVPGTPTKADDKQTLFYFPGAENTDGSPRHGSPPPSGRAILQPVRKQRAPCCPRHAAQLPVVAAAAPPAINI
jgi:hypothetical protein